MLDTFALMKKLFLIVLLLAAGSGLGAQAQSYQEDLMANIVKVEGGKMLATEYYIVSKDDGTTLQVMAHAEAPAAGTISRDNFLMLFSFISHTLSEGFAHEEDVEIREIDSLIGKPDLNINIYMAKAGVQVEFTDDGGVHRQTMPWSDFFK